MLFRIDGEVYFHSPITGGFLQSGTAHAAGSGTSGGYHEFDCVFQNGANTGTFKWQLANGTSGAVLSVRAGSYIEYAVA